MFHEEICTYEVCKLAKEKKEHRYKRGDKHPTEELYFWQYHHPYYKETNGEVSAIFYHIYPDMPIYKVGERIGQIKVGATFPMDFIEVDELNTTARGAGGYGSTGK